MEARIAEIVETLLGDRQDMYKVLIILELQLIGWDTDHAALIKSPRFIGPIEEAVSGHVATLLGDGDVATKVRAMRALGILAAFRDYASLIFKAGAAAPLLGVVHGGTDDAKLEACRVLSLLFVLPDFSREMGGGRLLVQGDVDALIYLIRDGCHIDTKIQAAMALMKLSNAANCGLFDDVVDTIEERGGIVALVDMLREGSTAAKACAADVLSELGCFSQNEDNATALASAGGIPLLVDAVRDKETYSRDAALALEQLSESMIESCSGEASRRSSAIVEAGGLEALVSLLQTTDKRSRMYGIRALGALMHANHANAAAVVKLGGLEAIVNLLRDGSVWYWLHQARAARALYTVTCNYQCLMAAARAGSIVPLVSLLRGGTDSSGDGGERDSYHHHDEKRAAIAWAAKALANLALCSSNAIAKAGGIVPLVELVRDGSGVATNGLAGNCKADAARALSHLCGGHYWMGNHVPLDRENADTIVMAGGIVVLVDVILGRNGDDAKVEAARTLGALAAFRGIDDRLAVQVKDDLVAVGGIRALFDLARDGTDHGKWFAADALAKVALDLEPETDAFATDDGMQALLDLARRGSPIAKESALLALSRFTVLPRNALAVVSSGGSQALFEFMTKHAVVQGNLICYFTPQSKQWAAVTLRNLVNGLELELADAIDGSGSHLKRLYDVEGEPLHTRSVKAKKA